ncbi:MAG: hypothetical protein EBU96_07155 [Actinobacteria bacterium]|nr:hypothetical protein [Actinomycetota bacterium]
MEEKPRHNTGVKSNSRRLETTLPRVATSLARIVTRVDIQSQPTKAKIAKAMQIATMAQAISRSETSGLT